jgi:glycosyltransferase involved in cell wall biosynthesis
MRFSILLPTRNRLELLKYAVQSVFDQDYQDWEIVVADNASEDDVAGYVRELNDARLKYLRSDELLPVTDNWNRALDGCKGDYFIMLGDDDCLLGGCLSIAAGLLKEYAEPELIYAEAIQFAYPNVIPGIPKGFVQYGYCEFLNGETEPFALNKSSAMASVRAALRFRIAYSYNMQHSIVGRQLVERLRSKGPFFQSPYPDYYATNALFLTADRILVCPWPLVGIGISPKSFGYFYFNKRESEGTDFLQNVAEPGVLERVKDKVVPGSNMNTSWLLAMETLKKNFPENCPVDVRYGSYRFMQFRELMRRSESKADFLELLERFGSLGERLFWRGVVIVDIVFSALLPKDISAIILRGFLSSLHTSHPKVSARKRSVDYENLLQLSRCEGGFREVPLKWRERLELNA